MLQENVGMSEKDFRRILQSPEKLQNLESIFTRVNTEYRALTDRVLELDFGKLLGPFVKREELEMVIEEAKDSTDEFLGIQDVKKPSSFLFGARLNAILPLWLRYGITLSCLSDLYCGTTLETKAGSKEKVKKVISPVMEIPLISSTIKIYSHFLLREILGDEKIWRNPAFREGFTSGVYMHVSRLFKERKNNDAYLYRPLGYIFHALRSAYAWTCMKLAEEPKLNAKIDNWNVHPLGFSANPIGVAVFSIAEKIHGPDIYKRILEKDYTTLKFSMKE